MDLREAKKIINTPNDVSTTKQNAKKPSNQTGIPYCWGGFNGLKTIKGTSWMSFLTAMRKAILQVILKLPLKVIRPIRQVWIAQALYPPQPVFRINCRQPIWRHLTTQEQ